MNIVTHTTKGSILTHEELDANFEQLKEGVNKASENTILAQFVGAVTPQVGKQRYYPRKAITISSIFAYLSDNAITDVVAQVNVNNINVGTITIPSGSDKVTVTPNIIVAVGAFLTVDIVSGTGNNLSIRFDY